MVYLLVILGHAPTSITSTPSLLPNVSKRTISQYRVVFVECDTGIAKTKRLKRSRRPGCGQPGQLSRAEAAEAEEPMRGRESKPALHVIRLI